MQSTAASFSYFLGAGWQAVKAAGPFMVTLGFFVILPLVWQLPICFITAELTTTFQVRRLPTSLPPFVYFKMQHSTWFSPSTRKLGMLDR